jgi:exodeoxyribonuclease V alpha subunit
MATRLVAAWAEHQAEAAVVAFLDRHGFDIRLANKLRRVWGVQAIQMLELNPYYMLAFASWTRTDVAALSIGVPLDDPRRLVGAVEAALYERLLAAHTLTSSRTLRERLPALLGPLTAQEDVGTAIDWARAEGAIVGDDYTGYQPLGAAALEARIVERIRAMLAGECPTQLSLFQVDCDQKWLDAVFVENEQCLGFALNAEQREAVSMAARMPFSVLTGGAGVGKTTVLRVVIDVARRLRLQVVQMALAGRAAKRMAEATSHEAMTIAKFLHLARSGQLKVKPGGLVVVDEASMLDLPTTFRILRHLPQGVRVLLVGDPAQLPPLGFGLVFHRMVESALIPRVELTEVHRQAAETGIPAVAASIREHVVPDLQSYSGKKAGVTFIECATTDIPSVLQCLTQDWGSDDWQVLAATKMGPSGIEAINGYFHALNSNERLEGHLIARGDPVIHMTNDYDCGLMNGTLGRVVSIDFSESLGVHVDFEGTVQFIPSAEVLDRLGLAYAISVHKAQGSQFRRVAVVVTKSRILDHSLIYTALTRGIEQVVFVGDRLAFGRAVQAPAFAHQRETAFVI